MSEEYGTGIFERTIIDFVRKAISLRFYLITSTFHPRESVTRDIDRPLPGVSEQ